MSFYMINETFREQSFWNIKGKEDFIDNWAMMSSPVPVLTIAVSYWLFVLKVGPDFMSKRQPWTLNNLLLIYNAAQVAMSLFLVNYGLTILRSSGLISKRCVMDKEETRLLATGIYYYFLAKVSELLDTVFFVLRKKTKQITFLHIYHHSLMMLAVWYTLKYEPTYTTIFLGTLNSFIHVLMYAYYGLSAIPSLAKYLWWKKYITTMQLVQFMAIMIQAAVNFAYTGCRPSYILLSLILFNATLFIYLFGDFYIKAYNESHRGKNKMATNGYKNGTKKSLEVNMDDVKHNGTNRNQNKVD